MDPHTNHHPWGWDLPPPPPPPLPPPPPPPPLPPNYHWQPPGFPPVDTFHHHHDNNLNFNNLHHDGDLYGGTDHHFHNPNYSVDDSGGDSQPFLHRKRKFECGDDGNYAKLYVAGITRNVTQEEVYRVFEEHGNVLEVVLLFDKNTGGNQEYCFVKYVSTEEADRAITALHNRFTFPGAIVPINVRYANGERERLGLMQHNRPPSRPALVQHDSSISGPANGGVIHKVYVDGINIEASQQEIYDIFSSYGDVADVYILRGKFKPRYGSVICGFVGFTQRYMAVEAINGLHNTYVMRGCDRPLVVRFAEPKKPRNGEFRSGPNFVDVRGTNRLPSISHLGIPSTSTQESTTNVQTSIFTSKGNQFQCPPNEVQQPPYQQPVMPSQFSQMSLRESHALQPPNLLRDVQMTMAVQSSEPASCASSGSVLSEGSVGCDWSEHICPDGFKYYFNCVTCESRWETPEEFAFYEQRLLSQQLQTCASEEPHSFSASEAPPEEESQTQVLQHQRLSDDSEKPQLPISCSVEHCHEQVLEETSPSGGPALVN